MPIKKSEFLQKLGDKLNISKKQAGEFLDAFIEETVACMRSGDKKLSISGFGVFKVVDRPARKVRNPRTGEEMMSKASKKAKFTPAKALKEAVL